MTEMGLIAATDAIIPIEPRYLETVGLLSVITKINEIREGWRIPNLRVSGILVTKMDKRVKGHHHLLNEIKSHPMLGKLLIWIIPMNEAVPFIDELKAQGLREDTLIVYTSDHSLNCGHHGIWGKGNGTHPLNMVEESIRIPLIFNQPSRLLSGQRRHEFIDHLDVFQTLVDYADVELPSEDPNSYLGRSCLPLLDNSDSISDWRNVQFGEYGNLRMIRTEVHKLVRRYPNGPYELFELRADPRERQNLYAEPSQQTLVQSLTDRIGDFFLTYAHPIKSGLRAVELPRHNTTEAWRI